jgi:DNA-binding GntR family transcriptional regulator
MTMTLNGEQGVTSQRNMMRSDVYDRLKGRLFTGELRAGCFVSQRELVSAARGNAQSGPRGDPQTRGRRPHQRLRAEGHSDHRRRAEGDQRRLRVPPTAEANAVRRFATTARPAIDALARDVGVARVHQANPEDRETRLRALDADYKFHRDLIDFRATDLEQALQPECRAVTAARINIGEPLQRLDVAAREHLKILTPAKRDAELAAARRLAKHIEISREHTPACVRCVRWMAGCRRKRKNK